MVQAFLLILSFAFALAIGSQTRSWAWSGALVFLSASLIATAFMSARQGGIPNKTPWLKGLSIIPLLYFTFRALWSPVLEFGIADFLLVLSAFGTCVTLVNIQENGKALGVFFAGFCGLFIVSVAVTFIQVSNPEFNLFIKSRFAHLPSGLFAAYNESANYLLACTLIFASFAIFYPFSTGARILLGVMSAIGVVATYYTRSRGGLFGLAIGSSILLIYATYFANKNRLKWSKPLTIITPLAMLAILGLLFNAWSAAQNARGANDSIGALADNSSRFYMYNAALEASTKHPWLGGGAHCYSWESLFVWDDEGESFNAIPTYAHNEPLESLCGYGLIGFSLLIALFFFLLTKPFIAAQKQESTERVLKHAAWITAGASSLVGMLVQSYFSFVFQMIPGTMLLGVSLGMLAHQSHSTDQHTSKKKVLFFIQQGFLIVIAVTLMPFAYKGSCATYALWPLYYGKTILSRGEMEQRVSKAIAHWPTSELYFQRAALNAQTDSELLHQPTVPPEQDMLESIRLNPHSPVPYLSLANIYARQDDDEKAEEYFNEAIMREGKFESAYRAKFQFALFEQNRAIALIQNKDLPTALHKLEHAQQLVDESEKSRWLSGEQREQKMRLLLDTARVHHALEDYKNAVRTYLAALKYRAPGEIRVYLAYAYGGLAEQEWRERKPELALRDYYRARATLLSAKKLPAQITESTRRQQIKAYDEQIKFLRGARITPAK